MIKEYKKGVDEKLSEHFSSAEFDCHCKYPECQITYIDTDLVDYLERKRKQFDKPIKLTNGFRCVRHNKEVGGKIGSFHLVGKAADIVFLDSSIVKAAYLFQDADGLGIYSNFIHVDVRGYKSRWVG